MPLHITCERHRRRRTGHRHPVTGDARRQPPILGRPGLSGPVPSDAFIAHVNARLALPGKASARLLAYLMSDPDRLVPVVELARAMGPRAASPRAVKVHVCRLRAALVQRGLAATVIETGPASYGLRGAFLPTLEELLDLGDRATPLTAPTQRG